MHNSNKINFPLSFELLDRGYSRPPWEVGKKAELSLSRPLTVGGQEAISKPLGRKTKNTTSGCGVSNHEGEKSQCRCSRFKRPIQGGN